MNRIAYIGRTVVWLLCAASAAARAQDAAPPLSTPPPPPGQVAAEPQPAPRAPLAEPAKTDPAAQMYMLKCAGCHTVGGGQLTGPDLRPVQTWPRQNVAPAVQRMEKNVGPLKPEDIEALTDLLQAPDAAGRLEDERKRIALEEMAKLEPANARSGEALFHGKTSLAKRGLACAACHAVNGRGGVLASDLTGSFAKLGETPLMSAIEGTTFPLMKAAYADNVITKQETIHLVKYLETAGKQAGEPARVPPLHAIGTVGAVVSVAALTRLFGKRNRGVRAALVRNAMRRSRS